MDDNGSGKDSMLDVFVFESNQLIEKLEEIMLNTEQANALNSDDINEIFRVMHTIKGSSAMMMYDNMSKLAHSVEDLFYYIREKKPDKVDISSLCDLVLSASDFIKAEVAKASNGQEPDGVGDDIEAKIKQYLQKTMEENGDAPGDAKKPAKAEPSKKADNKAKAEDSGKSSDESEQMPSEKRGEVSPDASRFIIKCYFEDGCKMENIRAYTIVRNLMEDAEELYTYPKDIINALSEFIMENGFVVLMATKLTEKQLRQVFEEALFLKSYELRRVDRYDEELKSYNLTEDDTEKIKEKEEQKPAAENAKTPAKPNKNAAPSGGPASAKSAKLRLISVNVNKLDNLMRLVGELVISESMVTRNKDLKNLQLDNFNKASRQLRKLTDELQDIVMSIRMVPIAGTFQRMQRIVRDMSRKLNKDVEFVTVGETTEIDKNIIDHLSDPLMHLIRNSMDHGVEPEEVRIKQGKAPKARVTLTAQNTGGDVMISVSDDGSGINKEAVLKKARENGIISKPDSEFTDSEIFQLIMQPGFSTNKNVTEYSGRGVGLDVVKKNIEEVGGSVTAKSVEGKGTTFTMIIPLTLAIADAMELSVGDSIYTLPTVSIKQAFRAKSKDIIYDNNGHEMIMIRGNVYPVIRLHEMFKIDDAVKKFEDGILIMIEGENKAACLFADQLIGEQQVVVKPLPKYLMRYSVKDAGIEGCTILGDGSISLILSAKGIISRVI